MRMAEPPKTEDAHPMPYLLMLVGIGVAVSIYSLIAKAQRDLQRLADASESTARSLIAIENHLMALSDSTSVTSRMN